MLGEPEESLWKLCEIHLNSNKISDPFVNHAKNKKHFDLNQFPPAIGIQFSFLLPLTFQIRNYPCATQLRFALIIHGS